MKNNIWSNIRGQIVIPSVFVIPSLLLFVYLIFETAKLSREKIRHQFAIDSAAFVEMTNYSDFLNRTAYVNGSFPYRIFKEAWECPPNDELMYTDEHGKICPYDMVYEAGAFPRYEGDGDSLDGERKWDIKFHSARGCLNHNPPDCSAELDKLALITEDQGIKVYIFWEQAVSIYKFYAQVYTLLGTVEESQKKVFEALTERFNFFRKSYYLNTGECRENPAVCAEDGLRDGFKKSNNRIHAVLRYLSQIEFWAKVPKSGLPPYYLGRTNPPLQMPGSGLFQLAAVAESELSNVGNGFHAYQGWEAPKNYFNVDVNKLFACSETPGKLCVHAMVASQCPLLRSDNNNCVWPNPTPKYQTRLYP